MKIEIEKDELEFLCAIAGNDYLEEGEWERVELIRKKYGLWKDPKDYFKVEAFNNGTI